MMAQDIKEKITMEEFMKELLNDRKQKLDTGTLPDNFERFERLMRFFKQKNRPDLEGTEHNKGTYENLQWAGEQYFDVINSFWTVFVCALINWSNSIENKSVFWRDLSETETHEICKICQGWQCSIFSFGKTTILAYATRHGLTDIGKETYASKAVNPDNLQHSVIQKFLEEKENENISKQITALAELTHTVANFMPCPETPFNSVKGTLSEVYDFLPLMIDWIEKQSGKANGDGNQKVKVYDIGRPIIVSGEPLTKKEIVEWKKWFSNNDNRENYCLEDYYYIYSDPDNAEEKHIKGIPLFDNQSLAHPLPLETKEIKQCLDEMVKRIKIRAYRLYEKANEQANPGLIL